MSDHHLELWILEDRIGVCQLDPATAVPDWAMAGRFFSITRTSDELSIVCQGSLIPEEVRAEKGWRGLQVVGPFEFSMVGILASLTSPLAKARIGLFSLSTFDTDYLLVKENDLDRAIEALRAYGHTVRNEV